MGTRVYFFSGTHYVSFDRGTNRVEGGLKSIEQYWPGMADVGFAGDLDAAVNWGDGNIYFFKQDRYVRYNLEEDRVVSESLSIADYWPGMQAVDFHRDLDGALNWGDGRVYFFKDGNYVLFNVEQNRVTTDRLRVVDYWPGMAAANFGNERIKAPIPWGDGNVYLFNWGNLYVRFNVDENRVPEGYPRIIADYWPGMSDAGVGAGLNAATDLLDMTKEIWLPNVIVRRRTPLGPKFNNMAPWRGVLHTTEGDHLSGGEETLDANKTWSHLIIEPDTQTIVQYMPLNVGCRALGDGDGTLPTNSAHAIQIEIVGRADNFGSLTDDQLAFIRSVMREVEELVPIPRTSERTFLNSAGVNSTPSNRMSLAEWRTFSGWCGHQHVPAQDHFDPGPIDINALLQD